MITTKMKSIIMTMGLLAMVTVSVTSCSNDDQEPNNNQNRITLADFEKVGKVYGANDDEAIEKSQIGKTPEMAGVPIIIGEDGYMYRRNDKEVNLILTDKIQKNVKDYVTDLQTFATVTGDPHATIEYVDIIGRSYIYDFYDPIPIKTKEKEIRGK